MPNLKIQQLPPPHTTVSCQWQGCHQEFPDSNSVYIHIINEHLGKCHLGTRIKNWNHGQVCHWMTGSDACLKEFKQMSDCRSHLVSHFAKSFKPFKCKLCNNYFRSRIQVIRHRKKQECISPSLTSASSAASDENSVEHDSHSESNYKNYVVDKKNFEKVEEVVVKSYKLMDIRHILN